MKTENQNLGSLSKEELEALGELKTKLITPAVLVLPNLDGTFTLGTDVCGKQVSSVLLKMQLDGTDHPVGYWSQTLRDVEKAYDTTHCECLAVVWSILLLRPYLDGSRFTVRTDHDSLKWTLNLTEAIGRLARCRLQLFEFEFDIVHRAGVEHQAADALSRLPTKRTDTTELNDKIPTMIVS